MVLGLQREVSTKGGFSYKWNDNTAVSFKSWLVYLSFRMLPILLSLICYKADLEKCFKYASNTFSLIGQHNHDQTML